MTIRTVEETEKLIFDILQIQDDLNALACELKGNPIANEHDIIDFRPRFEYLCYCHEAIGEKVNLSNIRLCEIINDNLDQIKWFLEYEDNSEDGAKNG